MLNNDEGSVKGQGASIMLPARGSPFAPTQGAPPAEAFPAGAETAPRDLSPEDVATMFAISPGAEAAAPAMAGTESISFAAPMAEPTPESTEADMFTSSLRADPDLPEHEAARPTVDMDAAAMSFSVPMAAEMAGVEEEAALNPSSPADRGAGGAEEVSSSGIPPGARVLPDVPITPPALTIPSTTVVGGQALPGLRAFAGAQLQISENVGITSEGYKRELALKGKEDLLKLFVPDGRLVTLWTEIDALEGQVSTTGGVSRRLARELLDRLAVARNYLMNDRDNFEEAGREVAEVKYLLARIRRSSPLQHPRAILVFLLGCTALIVLGFISTVPLTASVGDRIAVRGFDFSVLWQAILWGGVGGVTGALYGLWRHVARDEDYDPQYALWYYTNPLMGVILGAFVDLVMLAGLPAVVTGTESGNVQPSPFVLYFLAWAVGFQQNLAFSLANSILKKLIPSEEKGPPLSDTAAKGAGGEKPTDGVTFPAAKK